MNDYPNWVRNAVIAFALWIVAVTLTMLVVVGEKIVSQDGPEMDALVTGALLMACGGWGAIAVIVWAVATFDF